MSMQPPIQAQATPRREFFPRPTAPANGRWPVPKPALIALVDLGLSDGEMAAYFGVGIAAVGDLKARYDV